MIELEFTSVLAAPAEAVWAHAVSPEGINHELGPWLQMTLPVAGLSADTIVPGVPMGRSWLKLGGVIPVDYDDLCIEEFRPFYFREVSTLFSQRHWQHERAVHAMGQACRVQDRLQFQPRLPGTARLSAQMVTQVFRHRHRRLQQRFGAVSRRDAT